MTDSAAKEAVLKAIAKFDDLGRDGFFRDYRDLLSRRAKTYFIRHGDREYDMKAIVRVARRRMSDGMEINYPQDHSNYVAPWLEELGFRIVRHGKTDIPTGQEGKRLWTEQRKVERDRRFPVAAKENARGDDGWIRCEACGFRDREPSMFDAHHKEPLALRERRTRIADLAVLCPTCHRWAHAKAGNRFLPLSVEDVRKRVRRGKLRRGRSVE